MYKSRDVEIDSTYLDNCQIPVIDNYDKEALKAPITLQEIRDALWTMKSDKAPGSDGFPAEFYRKFWPEIYSLVYNTILEALENEHGFSLNTRRGIITLIEKEGKDQMYIRNWRPLSLLNLDYKILSKTLANRIYKVLPQIIHKDQSGFMPGRSIHENLFNLTSMIEWCHKNDIDSLLISYDCAKAFDVTEHKVLYTIMRRFGFPEKYISYIRSLYKNIESCTINCGFTSEYFPITRSVRQGCSLSAPLFLIIVEILGIKIRENNKIKGIIINGVEKKHSQFADDLWSLIHDNEQNLNETIETVENFCRQTGLSINYDKTQILRISNKSKAVPAIYTLKPLQWTDKVKILGIEIMNDPAKMCDTNFKTLLTKIEKVLDLWTHRSMSIIGKIQIVNMLVTSLATHKFIVLPTPSVEFFKKAKEIITKFIWNNKVPKVAYDKLIKGIQDGGLKLIDLKFKQRACKIAWIHKLQNVSIPLPIWQIIMYEILPMKSTEIFMCNPNVKQCNHNIRLIGMPY